MGDVLYSDMMSRMEVGIQINKTERALVQSEDG